MTYRRYAAERTIASVGVFLLALVLVFFMLRVWGRPAGGVADLQQDLPALYDFWSGSLGDRAWRFVSQYGQGSLGRSESGNSLTLPLLKASLVSLSLVLGAIAVGLLVGLLVAFAWRRRGLPGRLGVLAMAGLLPVWAGLLLSYSLGHHAGAFPVAGYCDFFAPSKGCNGPPDWAWHLAVPWLSIGLWFGGLYAYAFRDLLDGTERALAAAEESERAAVRKRGRLLLGLAAARRAGRDVGFGLGAFMAIEFAFSLHGLGYQFYRGFDPALGEAVLVLTTGLALGIDLLVNLVGAAIAPEWREG